MEANNFFYQFTRDELGEFSEAKWLKKLHGIIQKNKKISIGDIAFSN